ncbi:MAG: cell division ATP-binding protein FtsE [Patescibacteria group bacterium]|nr:cell division ATP-binding protein FtsE [Patescibacteria group bacterium]
MIKLVNVSKVYPPSTYALRDLNLYIEPKEFVSVVGQSGAGKTTLIKLLIAEEKPTSGKIIIGDWDISKIKPDEVPVLRRQIGVVFQDFKLLTHKNVYENVAFALEVIGAPGKFIKEIVPQVLKIVGLEKKAERFPEQLSVGEQQRVAIARAIVHRPKILAADEPTGNVDLINTREIIDLFKKINEMGTTIILVTHNREIVNYLKTRVVILEQGQIISDQPRGRYIL